MRYLLVVLGARASDEARFHDVECDDELAPGDKLRVDDSLVRIRTAIDMPLDNDGYDGTIVATRD